MNKKVISRLSIIALVFILLFTGLEARATFVDMPNNWARPGLEHAVNNNLLKGDNGKIKPNNDLTRAELSAIVVRMLGLHKVENLDRYSDVKESDWFYDDLSKAVAAGIFEGSNGKLNPNKSITREETFSVMTRIFALESDNENSIDMFSDSKNISTWARKEVNALVDNGYVNGDHRNNIKPKAPITRAEFATLLKNLTAGFAQKPGTVSNQTIKGNYIVSSKDVDLKGMTIEGDLILAEGLELSSMDLFNTDIEGRILVRNCSELNLIDSQVETIRVLDKVDDFTTDVSKGSRVRNIVSDSKITIRGEGKVDKAVFNEGADGSKIDTIGTDVEINGDILLEDNTEDPKLSEEDKDEKEEEEKEEKDKDSGGGSSSGGRPQRPRPKEDLVVDKVTAIINNKDSTELEVEKGLTKEEVIEKLDYKAIVNNKENKDSVNVNWSSENYSSDFGGDYTFTGKVTAKEGYKLAKGVEDLEVKVTVETLKPTKEQNIKNLENLKGMTKEGALFLVHFEDKPLSLSEVKDAMEERYNTKNGYPGDIAFNTEKIKLSDSGITVEDGILSQEDWKIVKGNGKKDQPFRITLLKDDSKEGESGKDTENQLAKIAMYEDGSAVLENLVKYTFAGNLEMEAQEEEERAELEFSENMNKPVMVEIYEGEELVGEGGMTESPNFGTALVNLTKAGKYELVVKDGEKELARIPLTVKGDKSEVTEVTAVSETIEVGSDYKLPETVKVIVEGKDEPVDMNVTWDKELSTEKEGTFEFTGTLTMPEGYVNTKDIKAKATIKVEKAKEDEVNKEALKESLNDINDRLEELVPESNPSSSKPSGLDAKIDEIKFKLTNAEKLLEKENATQDEIDKEISNLEKVKESLTNLEASNNKAIAYKAEHGMILGIHPENDGDVESISKFIKLALDGYDKLDVGTKDLLKKEKEHLDKLRSKLKLELVSSEILDGKLVLNFNIELTKEELDNVVAEHLRFQVTRVFRVDGKPVKMDRNTAKEKGFSEATDLKLDEVIEIYNKDKKNDEKEDQGGWGSIFNSEKLEVTQDENGLVTIKVLDNLFTHEEMTNEDKINSKKALNAGEGYKIGVHVGETGYKIQLNTTTEEAPVTGKFTE